MIKKMNKIVMTVIGIVSTFSIKTQAQMANADVPAQADQTLKFIKFLAKNNALKLQDKNTISIDEKAILSIIRKNVTEANKFLNANEKINLQSIINELEVNKYDKLQENSEAFRAMSFDRGK